MNIWKKCYQKVVNLDLTEELYLLEEDKPMKKS